MVCTRENAPGVKEASVLDLSAISDDLPKPESSSSGVSPQLTPLGTALIDVDKQPQVCSSEGQPVKVKVEDFMFFAAVSEVDGAANGKKAAAEDDKDTVADLPAKPILKSASIARVKTSGVCSA